VLHYSKLFEEFLRIARLIRIAVSNKISDISDYLKPQWNYVIAKFLPSESFWHSMQGLNGEIPLEHTEAGRNIATYRMWAKVAGAVYVAVILLPFAVAVGVRAPGAVVSAIRWTGGKLLLGTQYVYTTIKVFGLTGGGVRIVSDVYHFYLRNPITINQVVTTGTEIILDLTGNGTGMTPGSSPADLATDATQKVGKIAKAGISKLTDEVASAGRGSVGEIEMVEMIVKGQDGNNFYRIEASIKGGEDSVLKLKVDKHENLGKQIDLARQKEILFHGKARNDNSIADARGTAAHAASTDVSALAAADDINVQQLAATGTHGGVVTMGPKVTTPGKPIIGNTKSIDGSGASRNARHTSDNGAGSASRLNGATSKKPPKLKIDLKKPDAMKKLANADATSEDVVNVLKDPLLFKIYKTSLATSKAEAIQALNDIAELGGVIARFTMRTQSGLVRAEKIISDAVWALPGHLRGVLIEHALSPTQYKDWFRVGQLDRGFFPDIDFALFKNGLDQRVSVKTVDPFAKGFEKQISDTLPEHLETLVSGTINGRGRGHNITALLDVRMPLGTGVPRADLLKTLNDLIPKDIKKWVSVVVDEF
jgi:hypothetical protein